MLVHYATRTNEHKYRWTNQKHPQNVNSVKNRKHKTSTLILNEIKKYGLTSKNTLKI